MSRDSTHVAGIIKIFIKIFFMAVGFLRHVFQPEKASGDIGNDGLQAESLNA
jgi:hypothetical protein